LLESVHEEVELIIAEREGGKLPQERVERLATLKSQLARMEKTTKRYLAVYA